MSLTLIGPNATFRQNNDIYSQSQPWRGSLLYLCSFFVALAMSEIYDVLGENLFICKIWCKTINQIVSSQDKYGTVYLSSASEVKDLSLKRAKFKV